MPEQEPRLTQRCDCGKLMTAQDAEFWGECHECRGHLPVHSNNQGDANHSGSRHDARYHGGQFNNGEW